MMGKEIGKKVVDYDTENGVEARSSTPFNGF